MSHPALSSESVAVITGGASGIGLAAATRLARLGLCVCIADLGADRLKVAAETIAAAGGAERVMTMATDVSDVTQVQALQAAVTDRFGGTDILMNNAGIQPGSFNDDFTPREFVVMVLKAEFRMTEDEAHKVMITAHKLGSCVVAVFTRDVAETKATRATDAGRAKGYPLLFTTEPEE